MPTYNYVCKVHKEFEVQQSIKAEPLETCPKCVEDNILEWHCKSCNATYDIASKCCVNCKSEDIACHHPKPKRLISLTNFALKGGGWASEKYSK
jgi:putative FmdB family regulatory protein